VIDPTIGWEVAFGLALFFILLLTGLEVLWCFIVSGLVMLLLLGWGISDMPRVIYYGIDKETLMAVAYFILAGGLMAEGGIADKLVMWVHDIIGWVRGGLAAVAIVTSLFFGALTGSCLTSTAALAPLMVGRMEKYGYDRAYSTGVICASGFMGHLIPPSIPLLLYGILANQSIAALFVSTIIPGIIVTALYLIINFFFCSRWMKPTKETDESSKRGGVWSKQTAKHTRDCIPALLFPVIVLGGIYGGVFTPTEAAAVACAYGLVIGLFVYRRLNLKSLCSTTYEAAATTGMILMLVGGGIFFSRVLLRAGVAEVVIGFVLGISENPILILVGINILLLVLGMFMDTTCILIITVPLLLPLFSAIGVNLVHAGAVIVMNLGIGTITPPFAATIFIGARVSNLPVYEIVKPVSLFLVLGALPILILTTYVPQLSLWLPTLLCGPEIVGLGP